MSSINEITSNSSSQDEVEEYRCMLCNGYLSSPPLRILENGNAICKHCPSENSIRVKTLETSLKNVKFPCKFEEYGCKVKKLFGYVTNHHNVCDYKSISCFVVPAGSCSWKGQIRDVMKHFIEKHPSNIYEDTFIIDPEKGIKEKMVIFEKDHVITILYYTFDTDTKEFGYCIRYISKHDVKVTYIIKVSHATEEDCFIVLKQDKYEPYEVNRVMKGEMSLNLGSISQLLKNTKLLSCAIILTIPLNFKELAKLKCTFCSIYVIDSFSKTSSGKLACSTCAEKKGLKSIKDHNLLQITTRSNYPCRWSFCRVNAKYDRIRQHEDVCCYRKVDCPVEDCYDLLEVDNVQQHFSNSHTFVENIRNTHSFILDTKLRLRWFYAIVEEKVVLIKFVRNNCTSTQDSFKYFVCPSSLSSWVSILIHCTCCQYVLKSRVSAHFEVDITNYCSKIRNSDASYKVNIIVDKFQ